MRYGAMNFPVSPVVEEIEAIGRMGMDFVELAMDPPQAHCLQLNQQKKNIQMALARHRMGLVCHLPTFVYTAHLTDAIRHASVKEVICALDTAHDLGAEKAVLHPGYIDGLARYVPELALQLAMESLAEIYHRAQTVGITLCIENMFPHLGPFASPEDFDTIFQLFPQLKLVLDVGHANIGDQNGRRAVDFITRHGQRLEHLHVSDNSGQGDEHLPIGHGSVPFKAVVRALYQTGFDRTVTLEIFGKDREGLKRSRLTLEKMFGPGHTPG